MPGIFLGLTSFISLYLLVPSTGPGIGKYSVIIY